MCSPDHPLSLMICVSKEIMDCPLLLHTTNVTSSNYQRGDHYLSVIFLVTVYTFSILEFNEEAHLDSILTTFFKPIAIKIMGIFFLDLISYSCLIFNIF